MSMPAPVSATESDAGPPDNGGPEPSSQRRSVELSDLRLSFGAVRWIQSLPLDDRPIELALRFPRLANLLSTVWDDPLAARQALDGLLSDRRGGRRGFPESVLQELLHLRTVCDTDPDDPH